MKKKLLSVLSIGVLGVSLLAPGSNSSLVEAKTKTDWNAERYGSVLDIGPALRAKESDEEFQKDLKKSVKEQASKINFDSEEQSDNSEGDSHFTYDGGTKLFLNYEYAFKPFTLRSIGENVEIWVANDLSFPEGDSRPAHVVTQSQVDHLRDEFDQNMYQKEVEFFGTPDEHDGSQSVLEDWGYVPKDYYYSEDGKMIMLVDNIPDENYYDPNYPFFVAGFYSPTFENYFDRNIINVDSSNWEERLESTFQGTIAHEFQHLIHDDNDSDEETWINEGMSDFAEYLVGYGHPMGHVNYFLDHPENSLVSWDEYYGSETGPETLADYGQAYLLQLYMNDKFGKDFIKSLAKDTDNGIESINKLLKKAGEDLTFEELFRNFTVATTVDSPQPGNGVYNFESIDLKVNYDNAAESNKPGVPAWGGDYIKVDHANKIQNLVFDGIDFMPTPWKSVDDPLGSDNQVLWGNNGNEKDNALLFEVDLSNVEEASLQFDNFVDIEEQWDFGVVQVSTDDGDSWENLSNSNTRSDIVEEGYPEIKENLPGFTGTYEDWTKEEFDLTPYAGQEVVIAFRYMTDWASNNTGWFIDNISIPEINYMNDGSSTDGFKSFDEYHQRGLVDYAVTFINEKSLGEGLNDQNYRVLNINPFNVTEADALQLKEFFSGGNNYMVVWYAAPIGKTGSVDYSYEITEKNNYNKKK